MLSAGAGACGSTDNLYAYRGQLALGHPGHATFPPIVPVYRVLAGLAAAASPETGCWPYNTTSSASVHTLSMGWLSSGRLACTWPARSSQPATVAVGISQVGVPF